MSGCELVCLAGGLTVPLEPLQLLWGLENRGLHLRIDGDDIIANPRDLRRTTTGHKSGAGGRTCWPC